MEIIRPHSNFITSSKNRKCSLTLIATIATGCVAIAASSLIRVRASRAYFSPSAAAQYEILHSFTGNAGYGFTDGANPAGPLIQGSDENFYGTTLNGSASATAPYFNLDVVSDARRRSPRGHLDYIDRAASLRFRSTSITCLIVSGQHATVLGSGEVNKTTVTFQLDVDEGRRSETKGFQITLSNGYCRSGLFRNGRVEVDQCPAAHAQAKRWTLAEATTENAHVSDVRNFQGPKVTATNWNRHPSIIAIRAIVNDVNAGLKKRSYKTSKREFESCGDQYYTRRQIARNAKGNIVWYQEFFTYEDGSYNFDQYFDDSGHLRFVLGNAHAANGTHDQHRIYFDESGKRIWESGGLVKGPGCPGCFPTPYPNDQLAFDPAKVFASSEGCVEMKPKQPGKKKN